MNIDSGTYNDRYFITFTNSTLTTEETLFSKSILVYVNKEIKELIIVNKNNIKIEKINLFSILGKKIINWNKTKNKNNEYRISIDNATNGIYIVKIKTDKGIFSKKVSIQK